MPRGEGGGRPPKPNNVKRLHGDRKDRINDNEPVPGAGEIVPPFELSAEAQRNWDEMAPDRIRVGVLTPWDTQSFAQFCEALVRARKAFAGDDIAEIQKAVNVCSTLGGRFGWTPADRAKLTTGEARRDNTERLLSS